ncbi:ABC transporter ATP-binding protein [Bifidobacterium magnum]|uniref:Macrolide efflux ABC transporter, ATP-binding protein n=1 Tax=Bifidobacterium magnum TaxID=1692 RepID=A0A087BCT5_9BIFI|nr:ABC transporter ATP-binding protein [Bifidobacterium magnum]KFI68835.1 Macrolide efflux ABC transporter, ATP-binding protein [Bifidobacterium magnum]
MASDIVISARHMKKSFGTGNNIQTIYDDLNIDIYRGDFTVIMGASGAGKSTLLYALSGMDTPNGGTIEFDGVDITKLTSDELAVFCRKACGFVFQQIYLIDNMSLMDNVLAAGTLVNRSKTQIAERANQLFDLVNISPQTRKNMPSLVSGGEAQRAGMVRAVINEPTVLFADEPTGALNSANSTAVLDVFTSLHQQGQTIVMVTHDKKSALRANRVVYVRDGQIFGSCELGPYREDAARTAKFEEFLTQMEW